MKSTNKVRPKKSLGQHFLTDENIARKISESVSDKTSKLLEIGPGTGMLSKYLIRNPKLDTRFIETDEEAFQFLIEHFSENKPEFIHTDFLKFNIRKIFPGNFSIIGNFPYNISSQIFFKVLENRDIVNEVVCMIQKEVADRIASPPGNKTYGILSVLLQAWYEIKPLFHVSQHVFNPPPKVKSSVIRLERNNIKQLSCNEDLFFKVVKTAFNQRRKTLRNSLKVFLKKDIETQEIIQKRPEQLGVEDFVMLTQFIEKQTL